MIAELTAVIDGLLQKRGTQEGEEEEIGASLPESIPAVVLRKGGKAGFNPSPERKSRCCGRSKGGAVLARDDTVSEFTMTPDKGSVPGSAPRTRSGRPPLLAAYLGRAVGL
jgi:hypothetical protein